LAAADRRTICSTAFSASLGSRMNRVNRAAGRATAGGVSASRPRGGGHRVHHQRRTASSSPTTTSSKKRPRSRSGCSATTTDVTYEAKVIGKDPLTDSALIQMLEHPKEPLPVAKFGDSAQMAAGDWVMAIGNPFNYAHTVTIGVISAEKRAFPSPTAAPTT
jgi:hypothetical protein